MIVLVLLVILWTPYVAMKVLRTQHARTPSAHPYGAPEEAASKGGTDAASPYATEWSALDDRQLTRLLTDSAPRSATE